MKTILLSLALVTISTGCSKKGNGQDCAALKAQYMAKTASMVNESKAEIAPDKMDAFLAQAKKETEMEDARFIGVCESMKIDPDCFGSTSEFPKDKVDACKAQRKELLKMYH